MVIVGDDEHFERGVVFDGGDDLDTDFFEKPVLRVVVADEDLVFDVYIILSGSGQVDVHAAFVVSVSEIRVVVGIGIVVSSRQGSLENELVEVGGTGGHHGHVAPAVDVAVVASVEFIIRDIF